MTARDRRIVAWLRDFMINELGVVEYRPTIRRMQAAQRMLERWLIADDVKRAAKP